MFEWFANKYGWFIATMTKPIATLSLWDLLQLLLWFWAVWIVGFFVYILVKKPPHS